MSEMDTPFYCEHTYTPKAEGKRLLRKILATIGYVFFVLLFFLAVYYTRIIPLFALCPLVLWILVYFTWPYVSYDYYYEFRTGTLTLGTEARRKHRVHRRPQLTVQVKTAEKIYPLTPGTEKLREITRLYNFSLAKSSDKSLVIVFDESGKKCACILECTQALAKILRSYSKNFEDLDNFIKRL